MKFHGRKAAIVTARKPRARAGNRRLLAETARHEEHQRRDDAADAMFQDIAAKLKERKP